MALQFTTSYLEDVRPLFAQYKRGAEAAMAQVADVDLTRTLDPEMNAIAQIVKHLSGNMVSRWSGFPEADGEKPERDRDAEFEAPPATRAEMMAMWELGWSAMFAALERLTDADLARETFIRGERHSVLQAINRQIAHYSYHLGQIVLLSKHFASAKWQAITVPRGASARFNADVRAGQASQR
jgi:Protein of unknown function (DUF1572)